MLFSRLFLMCFLDNELGLRIAEAGDGKEPVGQPGQPAARLGSAGLCQYYNSMKARCRPGRKEVLIGHFSFDNFDGLGREEEGLGESPKEMLIFQPLPTK